jgi:hypothetical protein
MHLFAVELFACLPFTVSHTLNTAVLKVMWLSSRPCSQYIWQLAIRPSSLVSGKIVVDFAPPRNYNFTRLMSFIRGDAVSLFFGRLVSL